LRVRGSLSEGRGGSSVAMNRGVNPLATVICSDWLYARISELWREM
jgi:hypothetical protein